MSLQIHTIVSQPFAENTYVIWAEGDNSAMVIDPGLEPDLILEFLETTGLRATAIVNTHGHADHIAGNAALKQVFPSAPLIIGTNDAAMLQDAEANLSSAFGMPIISPPADRVVAEGDVIDAASQRWLVLDIPGHSPGHIVLLLPGSPAIVIGGDVLFRGSIGRTDFPGGSFPALAAGIRRKLYSLPDDTVVYPGHGPVTTIGHEKRFNPFVR